MEEYKTEKNEGKSRKPIAIAILLVIVFLLIACIRQQMELNELREKYEKMLEESKDIELTVDELEYILYLQKNDPEGFNEYMTEKLGYYDPSSTVYSSGETVKE